MCKGYDMNDNRVKTYRLTGSDMAAEHIFDVIINMVKTGEIGFIIIDSLNMLVPLQVFDESLEKKGGAGLKVVSFLGASGELDSVKASQTANTIHFEIPVEMPIIR